MDDLSAILRYVLALVLVLGLIGLFTFGARRFGFGPRTGGIRGRRRLAIAEVLPVDARRRLVLLRRDNVEHLVLLGPTQDLLIESMPAAPSFTPTPPSESP